MHGKIADILIIGSGPSGCVAAAYLKQKGLNVIVVEKSKFPRFVIGESLLPRCMDHFEEVGLLDCLINHGFEIKRGARFLKGNTICEFDFSKKFSDGWDWTWQVPRADFDNLLAEEIQKMGTEVCFGHEVMDVKFEDHGNSITQVKDEDGSLYQIEAKFIIDSSGFGRVLPRLLDLEKPSPIPMHSSMFTHLVDEKRPEGKEGTLITFDVIDTDTWFWVIPFSNGKTSIGFVGKNELFSSYPENPTERMQEMLKLSDYYYNRFKDVAFLFEPHMIKNYSKSVKQLFGKGYALTGNSAEFLDPVFSSGVTFATESGLLAAKLAAKELQGKTIDWESDYTGYIMKGVNVFATYVKEWYTGNLQKIFFHPNENPEIKRQICSVLAGYVWDENNPFVKNHNRLVKTVANYIDLEREKI